MKTTWMLSLIIGISLMLVMSACSVTDNDLHISNATYFYVNSLASNVAIEIYRQGDYNYRLIRSGDSLAVTASSDGDLFPFMYSDITPVTNTRADSIIIKFADNQCVRYIFRGESETAQQLSGGVFNLEEYDNYTKELVNQRSYTLRYSIDSADYKKATTCK